MLENDYIELLKGIVFELRHNKNIEAEVTIYQVIDNYITHENLLQDELDIDDKEQRKRYRQSTEASLGLSNLKAELQGYICSIFEEDEEKINLMKGVKQTSGAGGSYNTIKRTNEMDKQEKKEMIDDCNLVLNYIKLEGSNEEITVYDYVEKLSNIIKNMSESIEDSKAVKAFFEAQPQNACIHEFTPKIQQTIKMINEGEIL